MLRQRPSDPLYHDHSMCRRCEARRHAREAVAYQARHVARHGAHYARHMAYEFLPAMLPIILFETLRDSGAFVLLGIHG